ncbi:MlaD family protein [Gordonia sp. CPCC 205333]|uniref:MlaD family protein n=1 Tax=Gordonia sp. CPCC 205333 TaxID=3140790 RepID=UPI003AF3DE6B
MKSVRSSLILVLVFTALIGGAMAFIGRTMIGPVAGDKVHYSAAFSDVAGLYDGDSVRIAGVAVGKVRSVRLESSTSTALVEFDVQQAHRLDDNSQVAVRYQNLVGQRYLEVIRQDGSGGPQDPNTTISVSRTIPSFDVTALFNGVAPLIGEIDPTEVNKFAQNAALLLQGDGRGMAPALAAIDRITALVRRKDLVLITMVDNLNRLAKQIGGRSQRVAKLVSSLNQSIMQFTTRIEVVKESLDYGDRVLVPFVDLLRTLQGSYDSNYGPLDALLNRVIPFTPDLVRLLEAIPGLLSSVNDAGKASASADFTCTRGRLNLPVVTKVLVGGRDVVVCRP